MNKDFADWYRAANIEPDGNTLPKRWAAVEGFEVTREGLADASRLFYGLKPQNPKFVDSLRAGLQKADPAVKMSGNDVELAVLAGALLVDSIERYSAPYCYFAALAAVCPAAKNLRKPPVVRAIPELATKALTTWSSNRFAPPPSNTIEDSAFNEELREQLKAAEDIAELSEPLGKFYVTAQELEQRLNRMSRLVSLQSEETNILWWLLGEHSRDTNKPFGEFTPAGASLIAGKELSDLALELPGPIASAAFLHKMIQSQRKKIPEFVSIEAAVNEVPKEWRQTISKKIDLAKLSGIAPITSAFQAISQVPEGGNWLEIYKHAVGLDASVKISPYELADQFYLEGLMFRAWSLME